MSKVFILVEGQTEEEFIKNILSKHFQPNGIFLIPIIAKTKRSIGSSPAYKGGIVSYGKIEFDLRRLLQDTSVSLVTTMIDYYRLPTDFPGINDTNAKTGSVYQRVNYLEEKFAEQIAHRRFIPYFSVHEFEALLFSDTAEIVEWVDLENKQAARILANHKQKYDNPEQINLEEPPSKRILECLSSYDKVVHGSLIVEAIGIQAIAESCPHFQEWITKIEELAKDQP